MMMMYVRVHNITLNVCGVARFHLYLLYDILQYYYLYLLASLRSRYASEPSERQ